MGEVAVMICVSIAAESRRLGMADLVNARQLGADLLEIRLDRYRELPDLRQLLAAKPKPVIMACRRQQEGGDWQGTEEERLALLRQCIVAGADYVEIEWDVVDQIRPFPGSKRIFSYTNLMETPPDLADIFANILSKSPDVVKLVTRPSSPEEAWPLVPILARAATPTVVVGLGKLDVMLAVLGKKLGSPWAYAALERGMESYPGQPTISDLEDVYHYRAIDRKTRFLGVTGFSQLEFATTALVNGALAHLHLNARCLPLLVDSAPLFRKVADAVHLAGVIVDEPHKGDIVGIASELERPAERTRAVDLLVHKEDRWLGYQTMSRAATAALEKVLPRKGETDRPLTDRMVMITGSNATARAMAYAIQHRGGVPILASHNRKAIQKIAEQLRCRWVQFEGIYSTMHDVLIVCGEASDRRPGQPEVPDRGAVQPGYLKPSMAVMDLSALPKDSALYFDAQSRGCAVVSARETVLGHVELIVHTVAGQNVPRQVLEQIWHTKLPEF
jgi:3-dehydroquinate dehydratase / shikimate dehydrogenase